MSEEKKLTPAEKRAATLKERQALFDLLAPLRKPKSKRQLLDDAQQLIYAAWEASSRQRTVKLARQALDLSADCADAYLLLADLESNNYRERFEFLRQGVAAGRRALGKTFFRERVGDFWGFLESRPFMRAMAALASTLWETGQSDEALATWKELLRLNPHDNQGIRYQLLAALLELRNDDEAVALEKDYEGDGAAEWLYAVALLAFRKEGKSLVAGKKLSAAFKQNPHVPPYLLGRKKIPKYIPDQIISGSEDEAIACAALLQTSWAKTSEALDWLARESSRISPVKPSAR